MAANDAAQLLAQLRDIEVPTSVSYWPLAPGWWMLLTLALLALIGGVRWWLQRTALRRQSLRELETISRRYSEHGDLPRLTIEINGLLKRVAISRFPHEPVGGLIEEKWVAFLDRNSRGGRFCERLAGALTVAPYASSVSFDERALISAAERWIRENA